MKKIVFLLPVLGTMLLSGCSNDPREANAENFKAALDKHYQSVGCIDWNPAPYSHKKLTENGWPIRLFGLQFGGTEDLDAMVSAGMLKAEDKEIVTQRQGYKSIIESKEKVRDYDVTDLGRKSLKTPDGQSFCQYEIEVEKVIRWDEPFKRLGNTLVRVHFIGKPKNVQAWIDHPEVQEAMTIKLSSRTRAVTQPSSDHGPREMRALLKLTEQGWVVKD